MLPPSDPFSLSLAASLWICPDIPDAFCAYTFLSAIARAPSTKGTATTKRINLKFLKEFASNAAQEFRRVAATPPKDRNEETYFSKEKLENKNLSLNAHKRLSPGTRTRLLSRVLTEYSGKRRKPAFDSSNSNSYSNFTRTASVFSQCIPCVLASLLPQIKVDAKIKSSLSQHICTTNQQIGQRIAAVFGWLQLVSWSHFASSPGGILWAYSLGILCGHTAFSIPTSIGILAAVQRRSARPGSLSLPTANCNLIARLSYASDLLSSIKFSISLVVHFINNLLEPRMLISKTTEHSPAGNPPTRPVARSVGQLFIQLLSQLLVSCFSPNCRKVILRREEFRWFLDGTFPTLLLEDLKLRSWSSGKTFFWKSLIGAKSDLHFFRSWFLLKWSFAGDRSSTWSTQFHFWGSTRNLLVQQKIVLTSKSTGWTGPVLELVTWNSSETNGTTADQFTF